MLDYESAKIKLSLPKHGNESRAEHHDQQDYKEAAQIRQLALADAAHREAREGAGSEDVVRHRRRHAAHDVRHGDDHAEVQQIDADGLRDRDEQRQQHGDRGNALQEEAEDQQDHGDDEQDRIVAQAPPRLARPTAFGEV